MSIIEKILRELETKGLKASDLAKYIGKSTGQISMWKSRKTNPPAELIPDIAEFLGVPVGYLLDKEAKQSIISYSGNEKINSIINTLLISSIDDNDLNIIEAVLSKYKK